MANEIQLHVIFATETGEYSEQGTEALDTAVDVVAYRAVSRDRGKSVGLRGIIKIAVNSAIGWPIEADQQTFITLL